MPDERLRVLLLILGLLCAVAFGILALQSRGYRRFELAITGMLGVILAWLYERSGSLGPPIILHMVNNSIAIIPLLSG